MDGSEIMAGIAGLNGGLDVARKLLGLVKDAKEATGGPPLDEIQNELVNIQQVMIEAQQRALQQQQENVELRTKLKRFEDWEVRTAGFVPTKTEGKGVIYWNEGQSFYACPSCWNEYRLEYLQDGGEYSIHAYCRRCDSSYKLRSKAEKRPSVVRRRPSDWMAT